MAADKVDRLVRQPVAQSVARPVWFHPVVLFSDTTFAKSDIEDLSFLWLTN